jgi:hypothetical protein
MRHRRPIIVHLSESRINLLLAKVGLEPTPSCEDRILSPARLPFRHLAAPPAVASLRDVPDASTADFGRCLDTFGGATYHETRSVR